MKRTATKKNVTVRLLSLVICCLLIASVYPIATVAATADGLPDLSAYVKDPIISTITDFNATGAGTLANVPDTSVVSVTDDHKLSVVRNGGNWYQSMDWKFEKAQDLTGMAGILVKVDFTGANTNSASGGHGISVGIHTTALGDTAVFNDTSLGGRAFNSAKSAWQGMVACTKYSQLLVVNPTVYTRYAGYIYIPLSAFGEAGIDGLNSVTALTLYVGANTSGTAYVEGIYLVKGTQRIVDLSAYVQNADISTVTDFNTVGAGTLKNNTDTTSVTLTEDHRISVTRTDGDWYKSMDWTFNQAQNWSGAKGILVKVDYSSASSGTNGGHGVSVGIHTREMGESVVFNDPSRGGYSYTASRDTWQEMGACGKYPQLLVVNPDVYKCYAGYIYIPLNTYDAFTGIDEVTALTIYAGAITSGTGYIDEIYIVKGDVIPAIEIEGMQDTLAQGKDTYNVRFLASVNTLNAKNYGFTISAQYTDATDADNVKSGSVTNTYSDNMTVYTAVYANGELEYAPYGMYYAPVTVSAIPKNVTVKFTVTPYLTLSDGTVIEGEAVEYSVPASE